ncbi:MAG: alanine--tRNA ligase [Ignavibacteria bacterium]|nr:alanine--tRNA ligase [Ignavibacteria bacterium]
MKSSSEIRREFLDFFRGKAHVILPSASLIPYDDPSLLFTNAGMNQFKDVFLGTGRRDYKRAANTQKCIRVSGKHNDLEEVGHDGYHHTFFEMLGNWSFGDYYKREAIVWAWELLTEVWKLDKKRLWATVYQEDYESFKLWNDVTDIAPSHVLKFGEKDNFWEMGDTGPCGPCTEIHYDSTTNGCRAEDINSGNPDVIEIWNLVFIQFNRNSDGTLDELPERHVDTGMGFERIVRVLQNKKSNYETDIFLPLINGLIEITGKEYTGKYEVPMNVISDHVRALTFAIADGAIPSNEGRGYVLRRILRRAARYGRQLEMHKPFIHMLVDVLCKTMGSFFNEIVEKKDFIRDVILSEEESFNITLDRGITLFNEEIGRMKQNGENIFRGDVAFKLHDTYGFPLDLTQLMAREHGFKIDVESFDKLMEEQRERARSQRKDNLNENFITDVLTGDVSYDPYDITEDGIKTSATIIPRAVSLNDEKKQVVVLKRNPFYSESGGQVSDTGELIFNGIKFTVYDSKKNYIITDPIDLQITESEVIARVDYLRRLSIQRNHSATHLVHEALRRVLGTHVRQMGSYLDDKLLRFDFQHFHKMKEDEIKAVEDIVNEKIAENVKVYTEIMKLHEAKGIPNIKMFFSEKYSDNVRVVFIDEKFSVELCGGTHVKETSDIGFFKIIREESVSSGVRRIFAYTGEGLLNYISERSRLIEEIISQLPEHKVKGIVRSDELKMNIDHELLVSSQQVKNLIYLQDETLKVLYKLKGEYQEEKKNTEKNVAKQKLLKAYERAEDLFNNAETVNDVKIVVGELNLDTVDELKEVGDRLREKSKNIAALLYLIQDDRVILVSIIGDDLIKLKNLNAGKVVAEVAKIIGGKGGGKAHMAQAGGRDISKLSDAVRTFEEIIKNSV